MGAVTVLVAIVAVFISYSANQGLPFVPTYKLKVELPNAAKLVEGNDVRAGGFRVGVVDDIHAARRHGERQERSIAVLDLKLDKDDRAARGRTRSVGVRPRSALGLKYVELVPGRSSATFQAGDTDPARATPRQPRRARGRAVDLPRRGRAWTPAKALQGFGDALRRARRRHQHDDRGSCGRSSRTSTR